jgi:ketosteroid isomerase-like protein
MTDPDAPEASAFSTAALQTEAGRLVTAYVQSFNGRDAEAMAAVFSPELVTIHPDDPDVDVTTAAPFLERMLALWPRDLHYVLRRISERPLAEGLSEAWAELVIGAAGQPPLASEVVIYQARDGRVVQLTVYKLMHPTHPSYPPLPS